MRALIYHCTVTETLQTAPQVGVRWSEGESVVGAAGTDGERGGIFVMGVGGGGGVGGSRRGDIAKMCVWRGGFGRLREVVGKGKRGSGEVGGGGGGGGLWGN